MTTPTVTNPFQACIQIILKPNGVFDALEDAKNWSWIPFILVSIAIVLPSYIYFGAVDIEWYKDMVLSAQSVNLSPAEIESQRALITETSLNFTALLSPLGLVIINAVVALYLNLATKGDDENINGFTDWFGFTWWISLPSIISSVLTLILLSIASGNEINPSIISPTSLTYIFGLSPSDTWAALFQSVSLVTLWTIYLTAVGVNRWTDLGSKKSNIIAVLPYALIGGIWAIINIV